MKDDATLLREFVSERSEPAFAELLQRYIDLVYSAALRQLRGDAHLARDVTQAVFCELAKKARGLTNDQTVSGWLYNTARFIASRQQRTESRRYVRELAFAMNAPQDVPPSETWNELEQVLDDAMQDLAERDREAVILRYFRNESLAAVGAALGASENAARMRVERALEKLRAALERRGVRCTSAVLGTALLANAVSLAPAGLAAAITVPAISATAAFSLGQLLNPLNIMTAAKIKTAGVVLALVGTTTGLVLSQRQNSQLDSKLAELRQQQPATPPEEIADPSLVHVDANELARLRAQHSELMRLRGEVTQLRNEQRQTARVERSDRVSAMKDNAVKTAPMEEMKGDGVVAMHVGRAWGIAIYNFAEQNGGFLPDTLQQASEFCPEDEAGWLKDVAGPVFELTHKGSLREIANPSQAIIAREKERIIDPAAGSAERTYLFADGHTEIYRAQDGNFEVWEQKRQPLLIKDIVPAGD